MRQTAAAAATVRIATMRRLPSRHSFAFALLLSALLHLAVLLFPRHEKDGEQATAQPLQARLRQPPAARPETPPPVAATPPAKRATTREGRRVLTAEKSSRTTSGQRWSAAEKADMDNFLEELERAPKPTLAQRSLAMARDQGRQLAARDDADDALLEMRPNAPPIHPFSLESYLDGMLRRLNRSAGYVARDQRNPGVRPAAVQFRINPDGSLKSFVVLDAGDQASEIAFIKSVIERSIPFSPFPPDIDKAARSLGVTICIRPGSSEGGGSGFSRMRGNRCQG